MQVRPAAPADNADAEAGNAEPAGGVGNAEQGADQIAANEA